MLLGRFRPQIFAIMRILAGLNFALHGSQKLLGWPPMKGGPSGSLPPLLIFGGVIELVCGLLILVGFFADWAAFLASGEMAAAFFMGHVMTSHTLLPLQNHGEPAFLLCFLFLYIAAHGAGIWSIDAAMGRR